MSFLDQGRAPSFFPKVETEFDQNTRRRLDGLGPVRPELSAEEIKVAFEDAQREDVTRTTNIRNADEFVLLHPEFRDTPSNGKLMTTMLNKLFGDGAYTVDQYESAYQALCVTNSLALDAAVVKQQQQAATEAQRRAALQKRTDAAARAFDPNADYDSLSPEEIRKRADEELQREFEAAGARGGNGW